MLLSSAICHGGPRPAFLASVRDREEARLCLRHGAEIIDCKDPSTGALGALDTGIIRGIVDEVGRRVRVSATVGDLAIDAEIMGQRVAMMAGTGVDIVKVGFLAATDPDASSIEGVLEALGGRLQGSSRTYELVAVFFADLTFDPAWFAAARRAGFAGVMMDTADKSSGSLFEVLGENDASRFVSVARAQGVVCGLAGRLREADVVRAAHSGADIIGFRSALCVDDLRDKRLDAGAVSAIRRAIETTRRGAPCPEDGTIADGRAEAANGRI